MSAAAHHTPVALPPITHDIMLRALRGERTERVPVWAMRQAGRYLPEFRALRAQSDFFTVCNTPELCVEATLQPLRRFASSLDAVVIFSDILIVPQAMGLEVRMEPGPVFPAPLASPADFQRLTFTPDANVAFARLYEGITRTRRLAAAPESEGGCGKAVPVIGFCGAPWTLMSYMVGPASGAGAPVVREGAISTAAVSTPSAAAAEAAADVSFAISAASAAAVDAASAAAAAQSAALQAASAAVSAAAAAASAAAAAAAAAGSAAAATGAGAAAAPPMQPPHSHATPRRDGPERVREWLYRYPAASHTLLSALTGVCIELLVGAWRAGASILQVFESAGGDLPPALFSEFALPYMKRIAAEVRARTAPVGAGGPLLIAFARCAHSRAGLEGACDSAFDGLSLDWGWDAAEAAERVATECARLGVPRKALQGNLDPAALFAPRDALRGCVRDMLRGFGPETPLVANLGHGMLPAHEPSALGAFFDDVAEVSGEMRR